MLFQNPVTAQTFHLRHLILETWLSCQERLCVICGGHTGPRTGFPLRASLFLVSIVLKCSILIHSIHPVRTLSTHTS